jgi:hypothetical protein
MPKQYEAIRDALIAKGASVADAKTRAAKIYNARRKPGQKPVTGRHETLGDAATKRRS